MVKHSTTSYVAVGSVVFAVSLVGMLAISEPSLLGTTMTRMNPVGRIARPTMYRSVRQYAKREVQDVKTRLSTPAEEAIDRNLFDQIASNIKDKELEQEMSEGALLEMYGEFDKIMTENTLPSFESSSKITGTVISLDGKGGAYVDIGAKALAYVPQREVSMVGMQAEEVLFPGLKRDFTVSSTTSVASDVTLSMKRMTIPTAWARVRQMAEMDVTLVGKILSHNRGGFIVEIDSLQGFLPFSQMSSTVDKDEMIGQTLPVKFLEVDVDNQRLVVSNRRAVASNFKKNYKVGDIVVGTVTALKPYGAFVNLGGVNGLLHISQISHDHVASVKDVMDVGQKLKVMIMSRDQNGRVSLSTKRLEPTAGDMLNNPQIVFDKAEEMAVRFKEQARAAEEATRSAEPAAAQASA